jgi:predicted nuclease of predicted toxin-antitoxin system
MGARKLKILADENIPQFICEWLKGMRRIDLETVREARLVGQEDSKVVAHATQKKGVILAADKAFSEQNYTICTHPGIINVSKFNARPHSCKEKISRLLAKARKQIDHNVIHLHESQICVVKRGNKKVTIPYK